MRALLSLLAVAVVLALPGLAHADAIPGCPPGQHVVMNPTPPGAMHHGGAHCEPDAQQHPRGTRHRPTPPHPPPPAPPSAPPSGSGSGGSRS